MALPRSKAQGYHDYTHTLVAASCSRKHPLGVRESIGEAFILLVTSVPEYQYFVLVKAS